MKTDQKGFAHITAIILAVVIVLVVAGGYVVYSRNQVSDPEPVAETAQPAEKKMATNADGSTATAPAGSTISEDSTLPPQTTDESLTIYSDPIWQYSFTYPKTWTVETYYGDTTIKSPDYKEQDYRIGGSIEAGSLIRVIMEEKDPNSKTANDILLNGPWYGSPNNRLYSLGVKSLAVAGYEAAQGDSGYEEQYWTTTVFPYRNKSQITIMYKYGKDPKESYLPVYANVLSSFKIIP